MALKATNIWATFVRIFAVKNFQSDHTADIRKMNWTCFLNNKQLSAYLFSSIR